MIRITCPTCGKTLTVPDEGAGKVGKCACGERIRIPSTEIFNTPPVPASSPHSSYPLPDGTKVATGLAILTKRKSLVFLVGLAFVSLAGFGVVVFLYFGKGNTDSPEMALEKGLGAWIFGDYGLQTKDGISFYDDDRILTHSKLMKHEITNSRPVDKAKMEFAVVLVFESRVHTELRQSKKYTVYKSTNKWKIVQTHPQMTEWINAIKEESKEGQEQEEGRKAARELASGDYRKGFGDDALLAAFKVSELKQRIAFGESVALRKEFRLIREKKKELQDYQDKEDDLAIKEILAQMITGFEKIAVAEKELQ